MEPEERDVQREEGVNPEGRQAPPESQEGHIPASHEAAFMSMRTLLVAGIGLVVLIVLLSGLAGVLTAAFGQREPLVQTDLRTPDAPNLQIAPRQDLQSYLATQQAALEGYGWVDEEAGVARIPIRRAMELLVERGLPVEPRETEPAGEGAGVDESGFALTPTPGGEAAP